MGFARVISVGAVMIAGVHAQVPGGQGPAAGRGGPPPAAKAAALYDITGYWVSVVTEDWRFRMVTPPKGDYTGIILNAEGRKIAGSWDPAKDEAGGEQCKSYGAPAIMRVPGRLHITWQNDQTLKIEADAGQQIRLLHFDSSPEPRTTRDPAVRSEPGAGTWQGYSKATWEMVPVGRGVTPIGSLKVVTTQLKPGYLRKNGVPYSANTTLTEYLDRVKAPNGDEYLVVTSTIEDPVYLAQPFLTASHYRKQPDGSGWRPAPCLAK
jgi:hypothetical protein